MTRLSYFECPECIAWDLSAKNNGYSFGMCEECFNKSSVNIRIYEKKEDNVLEE
jgi:hypothetical protein